MTTSDPIRPACSGVAVASLERAPRLLLVGLNDEVSDDAPFVVSHLVLVVTVCGPRIAENRRRRGLMIANRSGSGT